MKIFMLYLLLLLSSCSGDPFKKVELLSSFRILGILADNPETSPGSTVNLRLIVSDPNGGGRVINGTTEVCRDPGISLGAAVSCDHDPTKVVGSYSIDTTTADFTSNAYTGLSAATLSVSVPATIFIGRSSTDQFNGVSMIAIFRFTVDGQTVSAFKRVVATNRGSFNSNPTGSTMLLNSAPITGSPAKDDLLKITSNTPESYSFITTEGVTETRIEQYEVAWYATKGKFDKAKSPLSDTVKYKDDKATSNILILALIRDERGGLDFVRQFFP